MNLSIIVSLMGVKLLRGRNHLSSFFSLSFLAPSVTSFFIFQSTTSAELHGFSYVVLNGSCTTLQFKRFDIKQKVIWRAFNNHRLISEVVVLPYELVQENKIQQQQQES